MIEATTMVRLGLGGFLLKRGFMGRLEYSMNQDDSWPRACFIPQRVVSSPRFKRSLSIGVYLPHPLNHGYFMVEPAHISVGMDHHSHITKIIRNRPIQWIVRVLHFKKHSREDMYYMILHAFLCQNWVHLKQLPGIAILNL